MNADPNDGDGISGPAWNHGGAHPVGPAPRLRYVPLLSVVFGLAAVAVLWVVITFGLTTVERAEESSARRVLANLARSFEGHVARSLDNIDQILSLVARNARHQGLPADLTQLLGAPVSGDALFDHVAVADAAGRITTSTIRGLGPSIAEQEFFRRHRDHPDGGLLVGPPVAGRQPGRMSIQLSHRLSRPDGSFGGVVMASVAPGYFTRFYSGFDLGAGGSVSLVGLDGVVRARYVTGGASDSDGAEIAGPGFVAMINRQPAASFRGPSPIDGVGRLYGYRVMERYPLVVVVGMTEKEVFTELDQRRRELLVLGGVVTLVVVLLTAFLYRQSTHLYQAELEAYQAREQVHLAAKVFQESSDGIMICDGDNRILAVNRAFTTITGYAPYEVVGRNPRFLSAQNTPREVYQAMWRSLRETGAWHGEVSNSRKDGEKYPEWLSINEVRDAAGAITHYIGIFSDATARKFDGRRLHFVVHYDALTELPNRVLLADRLGQAVAAARRSGEGVAVLFLDLDNFKPVNDTYGHETGDKLLQAVAIRLRGAIRETDTLARLGGDEFVLVVPELEYDGYAEVVAGKCRAALAEPFLVDGHEIRCSASLGIALYPRDGDDYASLVAAADHAMYAAKEGGQRPAGAEASG